MRKLTLSLLLAATVSLTACASNPNARTRRIRPGERAWTVKAHQRELLADEIMRLGADPQEVAATHHVLSNREGAFGGSGTQGGGCGCN